MRAQTSGAASVSLLTACVFSLTSCVAVGNPGGGWLAEELEYLPAETEAGWQMVLAVDYERIAELRGVPRPGPDALAEDFREDEATSEWLSIDGPFHVMLDPFNHMATMRFEHAAADLTGISHIAPERAAGYHGGNWIVLHEEYETGDIDDAFGDEADHGLWRATDDDVPNVLELDDRVVMSRDADDLESLRDGDFDVLADDPAALAVAEELDTQPWYTAQMRPAPRSLPQTLDEAMALGRPVVLDYEWAGLSLEPEFDGEDLVTHTLHLVWYHSDEETAETNAEWVEEIVDHDDLFQDGEPLFELLEADSDGQIASATFRMHEEHHGPVMVTQLMNVARFPFMP